jgi:hypothetical protein
MFKILPFGPMVGPMVNNVKKNKRGLGIKNFLSKHKKKIGVGAAIGAALGLHAFSMHKSSKHPNYRLSFHNPNYVGGRRRRHKRRHHHRYGGRRHHRRYHGGARKHHRKPKESKGFLHKAKSFLKRHKGKLAAGAAIGTALLADYATTRYLKKHNPGKNWEYDRNAGPLIDLSEGGFSNPNYEGGRRRRRRRHKHKRGGRKHTASFMPYNGHNIFGAAIHRRKRRRIVAI